MKRLFFYINIVSFLLLSACSKEELFQEGSNHKFWLSHKGAELPITVEGNTSSKTFVILLHGGPGGSAQEFNSFTQPFTDLLEEKYAMVYYDQRNAGLSRGDWNEDLFTIEQHIEDLEKVIEFIEFKFGEDIQIFLSGQSWGGYLGTAFLITDDNENKVKAWINIDGGITRNGFLRDRFIRIPEVANEQIAQDIFVEEWTTILQDIEEEKQLNISQYSSDTEINKPITSIMIRSENIIFKSGVLEHNTTSNFEATYKTNFHPFISIGNQQRSNAPLRKQMFEKYDGLIDANLNKLTLPVLSIYGKYDVRTPKQQGEYLLEGISTPLNDKKMIIVDNAGHAPMRNRPDLVATEMIDWIEKYR